MNDNQANITEESLEQFESHYIESIDKIVEKHYRHRIL